MDLDCLAEKVSAIREALRKEYCAEHERPWIVGFSGGKDSTLVLHLVVEMLLLVPPARRTRKVFVVSNDTGVESPVYQAHVDRALERLVTGLSALRVPVEVVKTGPEPDSGFWVNLLGRGYPAPNRNFRWCTDRMKIRPTTRFIREQVSAAGEVILLLGVRSAESQARAKRMARYQARASGGLSPHNDIPGCLVYQPIRELDDREVWTLLLQLRPPWGGSHADLKKMYSEASGGECPFVVDDTSSAGCGTGSARFGCWTCTVVEKDHSLDAMIENGFEHLEPLSLFRDRLKEVCATPEWRSKVRRTGQPGLGPLTREAREMLLSELLAVQDATGMPLVTDHEIRLIQDQWAKDDAEAVLREMPWVTGAAEGEP